MNWIYTKLKNEMLDVSYGMTHAKSLEVLSTTKIGH